MVNIGRAEPQFALVLLLEVIAGTFQSHFSHATPPHAHCSFDWSHIHWLHQSFLPLPLLIWCLCWLLLYQHAKFNDKRMLHAHSIHTETLHRHSCSCFIHCWYSTLVTGPIIILIFNIDHNFANWVSSKHSQNENSVCLRLHRIGHIIKFEFITNYQTLWYWITC